MSLALAVLIVLAVVGLLALEAVLWLALALPLAAAVGVALIFGLGDEVLAVLALIAGLSAAFHGLVRLIRWDLGRLTPKGRPLPPQDAHDRYEWANRTGPYAADE